MLAVAAAMVGIWLFEQANLRRWGRGERAAFWVAWAVLFAWGIAVQRHYPVPTLPDFTGWLFGSLWQRLLTIHPDIYW